MDAADSAVVSNQTQAFRILKYISGIFFKVDLVVIITALVFGSCGLVGGHLLNQLIENDNYNKLKIFSSFRELKIIILKLKFS